MSGASLLSARGLESRGHGVKGLVLQGHREDV